MRRVGMLLLLVALAAPSGALGATEAPATELPSTGVSFGAYELVPLDGDRPAYAGPATPASLDGVAGAARVRRQLSDRAIAVLERQGFVIVPGYYPRFHMAYDFQIYEGSPVFVTTDAAYHTWHLIFDKILRDMEQKVLLPRLETLVGGMLERAVAQETALGGTALADDASAVADLMRVAGSLLKLPTGRLGERARAEKRLILAHGGNQISPILGTFIDYSLYAPRGHYTRTPALTRYFLAMSVLGQTAFLLPDSKQIDGSLMSDPRGLRLAVLAAATLVGDAALEGLWREIFEPTAFLVGVSDDYSVFELADAVEATVPGAMADPTLVADEASLNAVAAALRAEREVRIDSERPSVRIMGTRFVIDSWVLDQLVWPNVGTEESKRKWASPLDLAAAFGSELALGIQTAAGETAYLNYTEQMEAMRAALAGRPDEAGGGTVYDAWLAALEPMWLPRGESYPDFMRTDAWDTKMQQTGMGSYAELRHDTILYVKQFVGELGAAEPPDRKVRNWVEPDPVAFLRLAAMARLMHDGLSARGLLPDAQAEFITDFLALVERFARLAEDELAGRPISSEDNDWLKEIGGPLESLWWRTADKKRGDFPATDDMTAIIADIGSADEMAVEIGTGWVDKIYVLVPDDEGRFQVATGGVFSYYEFLQPTSRRLTDEAWRKMLRDETVPDRPAWQEILFR